MIYYSRLRIAYLRVLFIGFVWPEPNSSAAGQNIMSYVHTCLAHNWQVSFCSAAEKTEHSENLSALGVDDFAIALNCSSFDEKIAKLQPEMVIFDRFLSFEQFAWRVKHTCPSSTLILDAEDLHFVRQGRHALIKASSNTSFPVSTAILNAEHTSKLYNDLAMRELACIYQADLTIVLSSFEQQLLIEHFNLPQHQVARIPFILSSDKHNDIPMLSFEQKQDFVFIGNFRHAPNYHAAKTLREQIWPKIRTLLTKQGITANCHVYGAYLSPKVKQLENSAIGFKVHGFASKQFEVISDARVMLAPISFGAGVKGKLLDAMRCNTPSITTEIGAEGITTNTWPYNLANDCESFIHDAITLYTQQALWQQAVEAGEDILRQDYDRQVNSSLFINTIRKTHSQQAHHRSKNFLQQLLSLQQFQSTRYMSQWIEAKNKHK